MGTGVELEIILFPIFSSDGAQEVHNFVRPSVDKFDFCAMRGLKDSQRVSWVVEGLFS